MVTLKGIIFNVTEMAVVAELGEDMWDTLLDDAGVDGVYSAIGDYPTSDLAAISAAAAARLGLDLAATLQWVGERVVPPLATRYPGFFDSCEDSISFLSTLEEVIHREVRKLYEGAEPPTILVESLGGGRALVTYKSVRCLDALAEGMLVGTARHFGERVHIERQTAEPAEPGTAMFQCHFTSAMADSDPCALTPTTG